MGSPGAPRASELEERPARPLGPVGPRGAAFAPNLDAVRCVPGGGEPPGCAHTNPSRESGSRRTRLPVSANTALAIAGATGGSPGSPTPPLSASLGTTST